MSLLRKEDFEQLPELPSERWLALRDLVEERLNNAEDYQNGLEESDILEYVYILKAAADELGVGQLPSIDESDAHKQFPKIRAEVSALATRLLVSSGGLTHTQKRGVSTTIESRLRTEVYKLKTIVADSNLERSKKRKLSELLDDLEKELDNRQIEYSKWFRTLGFCALLLSESAQFVAASATIIHLVGVQEAADQERQESMSLPAEPDVRLLPTPPRQLPAPDSEASDDEVPQQESIET